MKVRVVDRFVGKGRVIRYPGEIIDVSFEMADKLIQRGIVEPLEEDAYQPYETTAEYAQQVLEQRARDGGCKGCPKRSR